MPGVRYLRCKIPLQTPLTPFSMDDPTVQVSGYWYRVPMSSFWKESNTRFQKKPKIIRPRQWSIDDDVDLKKASKRAALAGIVVVTSLANTFVAASSTRTYPSRRVESADQIKATVRYI
jgi:hypothetical protein